MTAASVGIPSDLYGSFSRMVQHLDFTTCLKARSGKHTLLTGCFIISADVDSGEDKIFVCFSRLSSLLSIAQQINSGWNFLWHGDATFNFCRAEAGLITFGHNSLGTHHQNLYWTIMGGSHETKQTYEQSYDANRRAASVLPQGLYYLSAICCPDRMPTCLSSSVAMLYRTKFYQLIVQILDVVAPLSVLHMRL